jgi:hypothetical protein
MTSNYSYRLLPYINAFFIFLHCQNMASTAHVDILVFRYKMSFLWQHNCTKFFYNLLCVWEGGGGVVWRVWIGTSDRNKRKIIQIPNLKLLTTSTLQDGTCFVKWLSADKRENLNSLYNWKNNTDATRRLTSSTQTTTTQSHGYVTSVWKVQACWFGRRTL